ncbi:MAG: molybdopterin-binding protein, partial [Phenylobacterium sp.]|nr:molybdopterin-binding protein [Phenylobacterium sp.]
MAGRIDETLPFHPLNIAVLTISDTRDETTDTSGGLLVERLTGAGHRLAGKAIVHDDVDAIRDQLKVWISGPEVDVVLT